MDLYERVVEIYLTEIKQCPVIPQFLAQFDQAKKACRPFPRKEHSWQANPDFLIFDLERQQIEIASVCSSGRWDGVRENASKLLGSIERIETYLKAISTRPIELPVCLHFFVMKSQESKLRAYLQTERVNPEPQITALEHVFDELKQHGLAQ
jgi:hypothetical protein